MVIIHYEVECDMNKLVLLKDIKKVKRIKSIVKEKNISKIKNDVNKDYTDFNKKFCENIMDSEMNEVSKKIIGLFLNHNSKPLIDLINFLYEDYLRTNSSVEFNIVNKNNMDRLVLTVIDDYRKFQYEIYVQAYDKNNIALHINRQQLDDDFTNVVNFQMKKNQYKKACDNEDSLNIIKENNNHKIIVLDSNIEIPDAYEISTDYNEDMKKIKVDILKSWKYDFKKLIENNIYILFPLKVFDLNKRINALIDGGCSNEFLRAEIIRFFKEMNLSLNKIQENEKIDKQDVKQINISAKELLEFLIKDKTIILFDIS